MKGCWLWHKWGKWEELVINVIRLGGKPSPACAQKRTCERCGKTQLEVL